MINIRDSEIANILPHTVKTPAKLSLSHALSSAFKTVYDSLLKVRIWQDLDNADASLLELIATELSCPFYQLAETDDEKRRLIKAAYEYNRKIGTVEAVQKLVEAAFGMGKVQEWYEYGGEEFFFKVTLGGEKTFTAEMYELFALYINKIKNKRAKLEAFYAEVLAENNIYYGMTVLRHVTHTIDAEIVEHNAEMSLFFDTPILQHFQYGVETEEYGEEDIPTPSEQYNKLGTTTFENFILG